MSNCQRQKVHDYLLVVLLAAACILTGLVNYGCQAERSNHSLRRTRNSLPDQPDGGRLSVFLNLINPGEPRLKMQISSVEVLAGEQWIPLIDSPVSFDSKLLGRGQLYLGSRKIAPARYRRMRLGVSDAWIWNEAGEQVRLEISQTMNSVLLVDAVDISAEASRIVLMGLDVGRTISGASLGPLALSSESSQQLPVTANLLYVAVPEYDSVYIVRTDNSMVAGAFWVPGKPIQSLASPEAGKLYVLASETSRIMVFDLVSKNLLDEIKIPLAVQPVHMALGSDPETLYVLDKGGSLILMSLKSGMMLARNKIGQRPTFITVVPDHKQVALSSSLDKTVYILDSDSLEIESSIQLGGSAQGALLMNDDRLYVAEAVSNTVSVYDLKRRQLTKRIAVASGPVRLVDFGNRVYVASRSAGKVSLILAGQNFVSRAIDLDGQVFELAVSGNHRLLYAGTSEGGSGGISVIETTSNRLLSRIELGSPPAGLTVVQ